MRKLRRSSLGRVLALAVLLWGAAVACNLSNLAQSGPEQPGEAVTVQPAQPVETQLSPAQPAATQLQPQPAATVGPGSTQPAAPQPAVTQPANPSATQPANPAAGSNIFMPSISSGAAAATETEPSATVIASDPYVDVTASPNTTLKVGDTLTVIGKPVEIGLPTYDLNVRDDGVENAPSLVQVTFENKITTLTGASAVLELVSSKASLDQVTFVLRAKAAGTTTVTINVAGEVHPSTGPASSIEAGASGSVLITVK